MACKRNAGHPCRKIRKMRVPYAPSALPLLSFPAEVVHSILAWLPIDGVSLRTFAHSSKHLASLVLGNVKFARIHFRHQCSLSGSSCLWRYLDSAGLYGFGWEILPRSYQAAIFSAIIVEDYADECLQDDESTPYDMPDVQRLVMEPSRWKLPEHEAVRVIDLLLAEPGDFMFSTHGGCLMRWFCIFGYAGVVSTLLDLGVDPMDRKGSGLSHAAEYGHLSVVDLLLSFPTVDPEICDGHALRVAIDKGQLNVVKRLLADERVDPSGHDSFSLCMACSKGNIEVVRFLLADSRVNAAAVENYPLAISSEKGFADVVEELLKREEVDPCVEQNYCVRAAAAGGHEATVALLVKDVRVVGMYRRNWPQMAREQGHSVIARLLSNTSVDSE